MEGPDVGLAEAIAPEIAEPEKDGPKKDGQKAKSDAQLRTAARRMADQALGALGRILDGDGQDAVRLAAAREVLDRGYGKSKATPAAAGTRTCPPYTVVVQRFGEPADARLEDFD